MTHVLSIDLGTTGCRAAIFDHSLTMIGKASATYSLITLSASEIEQDAEDWWKAVVSTVQNVCRKTKIEKNSIRSISISAQTIGFVPIDQDGNTLFNSISWLDTRAKKESALLGERYGNDQLYQITGKRNDPIYTLPKLLWFKSVHPDIYEKAYKLLLPLDYLIYRLCGRFVTDHTCGSSTMYYQLQTQDWSTTLLEDNGLDPNKLPELLWAGDIVGPLTREAAEALGLSSDTIVCMGAQDQKCASLGACLDQEITTVSLGTASLIEQKCTSLSYDPNGQIPVFSYLNPGEYVLEGILSTCGASLEWFRTFLGNTISFAEMDALADKVPAGRDPIYFYPYFTGGTSPHWKGSTASFIGLSLSSQSGHVARSIMEGIAFHIRANIDAMSSISSQTDILHIFGGGSRSAVFCQIIADVTGREVRTFSNSDTALIGAAMLAMKGIGENPPNISNAGIRYQPQFANTKIYSEEFIHYERIRQNLYEN